MTTEVNAPDSASTEQGTQAEAPQDSGTNSEGADYYKDEIRKISSQRDSVKAKLREALEGAESLRAQTAEQLAAKDAEINSLKAEMRTGEIKRVLLAEVPEANRDAVFTLYQANESELNNLEHSPAQVAANAIEYVKGKAAVLFAAAEQPAPAPKSGGNETAPTQPPAKLGGQKANEDPIEHLRPDVRAAKAQAAFRKKYPGTTGFGL